MSVCLFVSYEKRVSSNLTSSSSAEIWYDFMFAADHSVSRPYEAVSLQKSMGPCICVLESKNNTACTLYKKFSLKVEKEKQAIHSVQFQYSAWKCLRFSLIVHKKLVSGELFSCHSTVHTLSSCCWFATLSVFSCCWQFCLIVMDTVCSVTWVCACILMIWR